MKIQYSVGEIGGFLDFEVKPCEQITGFIRNIDGWMESDIQSGTNYRLYLNDLKRMSKIKDFSKVLEYEGNAYKIRISNDRTTISYIYEDSNPSMIPCTLPTKMLIRILKTWKFEKRKFEVKKKLKKIFKK